MTGLGVPNVGVMQSALSQYLTYATGTKTGSVTGITAYVAASTGFSTGSAGSFSGSTGSATGSTGAVIGNGAAGGVKRPMLSWFGLASVAAATGVLTVLMML